MKHVTAHKGSPKRKQRYLLALLISGILAVAVVLLWGLRTASNATKKEDLTYLSQNSYDSVLLSMHDTTGFCAEDFQYYRGLTTLVADHALQDTSELSEYLEIIFNSDNALTNLYLCMDPELLWNHSGKDPARWEAQLQQGLCQYLEGHPDVFFEILLPYPQLPYWLDKSAEDLDTLFTVYHSFLVTVSAYANVKVYWPGIEDWLITSPENYAADSLFTTNEGVTQKLFLYVFCDGEYWVTPTNEDFFRTRLTELIQREQTSPTQYPDLSSLHIVFFGDSVLGNFTGSLSIPGYISSLSGATTDNHAIGGTRASVDTASTEPSHSFPIVVGEYLEGNMQSSAPTDDQQLCFVINYGFNDYFTGAALENLADPYDVSTYLGGLRTGIARLQERYPDALYLLVTSTHTSYYEGGTLVMSEQGAPLEAYVNALSDLSEEMNLALLNTYHDSIITADNLERYLGDGCHPNERGMLVLATAIMERLAVMRSDPN